jgi:cyclic beta-1,2-glucan synthetase
MKRLDVDLVIVNERASSYTQDLQAAIETAVRSSQSRPPFGEDLARGSVYALRADLMSGSVRDLLQSVARVVLLARRGSIANQLALWSSSMALADSPTMAVSTSPFSMRAP